MKILRTIILTASVSMFLISSTTIAKSTIVNSDSVNVMVEASLFFEAYKNKQYEMWTIEKGFNVVNFKPDFMPKYEVYKKIEKVIYELYADSTTPPETKELLADTVMYLYNRGIEYDKEDMGYYMLKKAYVIDQWLASGPDSSIAAYEAGLAVDSVFNADKIYYADQLGLLYKSNMRPENDYQIKALDIYSKLSELEPDNGKWISMIESLAENDDELVDILKKAWYLDKSNSEKAWKYAKICKKVGNYEASIEPLKFLIDANPDVVNYWNEIARAYQKNDQIDKAISSYKKLIDLQPDNRDNYFNLALLYKDMNQFSVSRSYLQKAARVSSGWDYPLYIEAGLYEQAARNCGFEFEDKCVYQLAADTYRQAANLRGENASAALSRIDALTNSVPSKEDYFFRKKQNGDVIKIEGKCYDWIGKSITVVY